MSAIGSTVMKAVIYPTAKKDDPYTIEEVIVLLMMGHKVLSVNIIGANIDEGNKAQIISDIINEETDGRYISPDITEFNIKNASGDNRIFIEEIYDILEEMDSNDELEYIVYNDDNLPEDFYDELYFYIEQHNDLLIPVNFKQVFYHDPDISQLLQKYGMTDHLYSKESPLSGAVYSGILFDVSLGK